MTPWMPDTDAAALVDLLDELLRLQTELEVVLRSKLDAMKRADTAAIQSASAREGLLIRRLAQLDRRRAELLANWPAERPRGETPRTLSLLAESLAEPHRGRMTALAAGLRQRVAAVADLHRVITIVSAEMLAHYRKVFDAMTRGPDDADLYTPRGRAGSARTTRVLDAVG